MREEKCALGSCKKPLKIAEKEEEAEQGDEFWLIQFSYAPFFFCSHEHSEEYAN